METAVSGLVQASLNRHLGGPTPEATPAAAPADWRDGWFIYQCADVSDETAAQITKAEAWPAFNAFFRLLWKRQREAHKAGRTEAEDAFRSGVLIGEGVRGLARSIGLTPAAMNRQLGALHRLGILAVAKPPAAADRDENGRFVRRPTHRGLVPASRITFNAGDEHRRPANRQGWKAPLKVVGTDGRPGRKAPLKGRTAQGANRTTPISPLHISPSAGGQASGIGRPAEAPRTRPAAGEDAPPLRPWTGEDADRKAWTLRRLEAQKAARDAEDAAWRERMAAEAQAPTQPAPTATEAARNLEAAVADLPPASRQKAKRVAKGMAKADRQADEDAAIVLAAIERKRREAEEGKAADAKAFRDAAKAASRKARQTKREPVGSG